MKHLPGNSRRLSGYLRMERVCLDSRDYWHVVRCAAYSHRFPHYITENNSKDLDLGSAAVSAKLK